MASSVAQWQPVSGLSSGAAPLASFPNNHLLRPAVAQRAAWSKPTAASQASPLEKLQAAVREEDWEHNYERRLTAINMRAEWSASTDRCQALQWLIKANGAHRALEIGSFCGVGALALAEGLPADGEVHVLELDRFVVEFGKRFHEMSPSGSKIRRVVGPALPSLEDLARRAEAGESKPFDLVIVDADKEGMQQYFDLVWTSPNLLSEGAVVCVDMTPFKGQAPTRYLKYGFPHRWEAKSGQAEIDAFRARIKESQDVLSFEFCNILVVKKAPNAKQ